ncbi:MAG: hypothetical protein ACJ74J_18260 [Blastocatellia bacterium]
MKRDLSFLLQPPDFSMRAVLTIDALAPLSMVTSMPGKYYRSQPEPTDEMLYGLLENALGWHITGKTDASRDKLVKKLAQRHRVEERKSGVDFKSLLQFHVRFTTRVRPPLLHYDDLWSQHLRGASFVGGSRNYDYRAIPIMNLHSQKAMPPGSKKEKRKIDFNDKAEADKDPTKITTFQEWDTIHLNVVRPYFPQYYASPTPREYVIPQGAYRYRLETSKVISRHLGDALENPTAPLYLGSSDGWVEVNYEELS